MNTFMHKIFTSRSRGILSKGPGWLYELVAGFNNSYKPITNTAWIRDRLCKLQKRCTRLATQVIKFTSCLPMVCGSLLVFPAFSTTKTGRHDIAEILLKVALRHQKNKSINLLSIMLTRMNHPFHKSKFIFLIFQNI